jgi:hypothetical protein
VGDNPFSGSHQEEKKEDASEVVLMEAKNTSETMRRSSMYDASEEAFAETIPGMLVLNEHSSRSGAAKGNPKANTTANNAYKGIGTIRHGDDSGEQRRHSPLKRYNSDSEYDDISFVRSSTNKQKAKKKQTSRKQVSSARLKAPPPGPVAGFAVPRRVSNASHGSKPPPPLSKTKPPRVAYVCYVQGCQHSVTFPFNNNPPLTATGKSVTDQVNWDCKKFAAQIQIQRKHMLKIHKDKTPPWWPAGFAYINEWWIDDREGLIEKRALTRKKKVDRKNPPKTKVDHMHTKTAPSVSGRFVVDTQKNPTPYDSSSGDEEFEFD